MSNLLQLGTLAVLGISLGRLVFFRAGVWPADCQPTLAGISLASALYWLFHRRNPEPPPRLVLWPIIAFLCYLTLQVIPLGPRLLLLLSPARAELLSQLGPISDKLNYAPLSVTSTHTTFYVSAFVGYSLTFFLVRDIASRLSDRCWIASAPLILIALLEALLGISQAYVGSSRTEATGTYANRDHFSGFLELVFPFALIYGLRILQNKSRDYSISLLAATTASILWGSAAIMLVAIAYSLSRMGFAVTSVLSLLVFAFWVWPSNPTKVWKRCLSALIPAILALALMLFMPTFLLERFAQMSTLGIISGEARFSLWKQTTSLISAFPLFGCGLGGFEAAFLKYQVAANLYRAQFAHNDYLQYLAELGLVGASIFGCCFTGIVAQMRTSLSHNCPRYRRLLTFGCAASMLAIGLHSMVDFNTYVPANAMTIAWIAGLASTRT